MSDPGTVLAAPLQSYACCSVSGRRFHADPLYRLPLSGAARLRGGVGHQRRGSLQVLEPHQPDLIITDMQMPKMSGSELITALKSKPDTAGVPIMIVADRAGGFDQTEKRANFSIYKDIDIEAQLAKALDAVLGKASQAAAGC